MRRLLLLIAAGSLWLFLAAIPALADGGPHLTSVNSGTSSLTADSCAGCHRAHSAQGQYLLAASSEEALCLTCHGPVGPGATTNVEDGVQYVPTGSGTRSGTLLGALRDGGFLNAEIGTSNPSRALYIRGYDDNPYNTVPAISTRPRVGVGTSAPVTSAHIDLFTGGKAGVADTGRQWGSGSSGLGAASVTLSCADCHNPHGNGNYRILNPVPGNNGTQVSIPVKATYANSQNTIVTATQHSLITNDQVTLAGVSGLADGKYYVINVLNGFTFQVASTINTATAATVTTAGTGGTVLRSPIKVTDSAVDPDNNGSNPTKNYTILQIKGAQGVPGTFLLYARDVTNAPSGVGATAARTATVTAVVTAGSTNYLQTTGAHGFTVGDQVTISGMDTQLVGATYTVAGIRSSGTVYDQFSVAGTTQPTTGTGLSGSAVRAALTTAAYSYTATSGDYFRRTVPWNPKLTNTNCDPTLLASTSTGASPAQIANAAYCATQNDAPNGVPAAITQSSQGGRPSDLIGQQAFLDQMSAWCASCHTRYYQNSNQNPALSGANSIAPSSDLSSIPVGSVATNGTITPGTYAPTGFVYSAPGLGDQVDITGTGTAVDGTGRFVISTSQGTFKVSATRDGAAITLGTAAGAGGTFTRTYADSASGWWFPRNTNGTLDANYKYQHSTASNRACTVCHVGHGSNAVMTGQNGTTFSLNEPYPDGTTTSVSSRLLKVNNRGTCQMCHDPTGTNPAGSSQGATVTTVP